MNKEYIIYKITNRINEKVYIGQTVQVLTERWKQHVWTANAGKTTVIARAIRKYGEASFDIEHVASAMMRELLNDVERDVIGYYQSNVYGYNCTSGGGANYEVNEETRKALSDAIKRRFSDSEWHEKWRESQRDPTSRRRRSESGIKKWQRPEHRALYGPMPKPEPASSAVYCDTPTPQLPEPVRRRTVTEATRKRQAAARKAYWDKRRAEGSTKTNGWNEESKRKARERAKDPSVKSQRSEIQKRAWTPERRQRRAEMLKRKHLSGDGQFSPESNAKRVEGIKKTWQKKKEWIAQQLLYQSQNLLGDERSPSAS